MENDISNQIEQNFQALLDEYDLTLTKGSRDNYMPILRSFEKTILSIHHDATNLDEIFQYLIVSRDIIKAGINYIDNSNRAYSEKSITKYLLAITDFDKKIIQPRYPNSSLNSVSNFQDLYANIMSGVKKDLLPSGSFPHIRTGEYKLILKYISPTDPAVGKRTTISVAFRLMLLYGFKLSIISSLKKADFSEEKRTLLLNTDTYKLELEVPYKLSKDFSLLKDKVTSVDLLFSNEEGKEITSDYFDEDLTVLKQMADKDGLRKACFTLTGIAKYGVINMLVEGMNPLAVSDISGMGDTYLKYCQEQAKYILESENINHHVNSHIRGIRTFDELQY